ncbi:hypothetical protein [Stagnihabitans tardus]|uniref:hypothetical protein n=1 Tax=Stagnihabitans tardus TaxID=2699202 RepID=UPI0033902139
MSLAELRDRQKELVKAIATHEARQKAEARGKLAILAPELGYTFYELEAVEGPKRKRAPSTTIYKHPENPTVT